MRERKKLIRSAARHELPLTQSTVHANSTASFRALLLNPALNALQAIRSKCNPENPAVDTHLRMGTD